VSQSCGSATTESNSVARSCDCLTHRFGNAGDRPDREPRYPSDMSDAEWAVVHPSDQVRSDNGFIECMRAAPAVEGRPIASVCGIPLSWLRPRRPTWTISLH